MARIRVGIEIDATPERVWQVVEPVEPLLLPVLPAPESTRALVSTRPAQSGRVALYN